MMDEQGIRELSQRFFELATVEMSVSDKHKFSHWGEYTVERVRCIMETAGLWDGFVEWHGKQLQAWYQKMLSAPCRNIRWIVVARGASADILTNPTLLIQACISFMEGRDAA